MVNIFSLPSISKCRSKYVGDWYKLNALWHMLKRNSTCRFFCNWRLRLSSLYIIETLLNYLWFWKQKYQLYILQRTLVLGLLLPSFLLFQCICFFISYTVNKDCIFFQRMSRAYQRCYPVIALFYPFIFSISFNSTDDCFLKRW